MLPKPSKTSTSRALSVPDHSNLPAVSRTASEQAAKLTLAIRDMLFASVSDYRRVMQPYFSAWKIQSDESERQYWQNVTLPMALRKAVKMRAHEFNADFEIERRTRAVLCCEFIHWRRTGRSVISILREFQRRADNLNDESPYPEVQRGPNQPMSLEATRALYAQCHRFLARRRLPGSVDFIKRPDDMPQAFARQGGIRIPLSFLSAFERAEGLRESDLPDTAAAAREHYLAGLAKIFSTLQPGCPPLLYILMERGANLESHMVVCDLTPGSQGVFDANFGFIALSQCADLKEFAQVMAQMTYRYAATALVAFQDTSTPRI